MRNCRTLFLVVGALLFGAPAAFAQQGFNFQNFSSTTNLTLNGNAARAGNVLRLTPAAMGQAGSAWFNTQQVLTKGFTTSFQFRITNPSSTPADGIAFVIQNSSSGLTALGQAGGAIGYGGTITCTDGCTDGSEGISNSVAIEFDTFQNPWDPNPNHVAIQSCGISPNTSDHTNLDCSIGSPVGLPTFADGNVHTVVVNYDPPCDCDTPNLTVYVDNGNTPVLTAIFNITTLGLTEGGSAFVGFTGATGFFFENQDILNWSFTPHSGQTQNRILFFNPGTHVSQTASYDCGTIVSGACTGAEASSIKLTVGQVTQPIALVVSETLVDGDGSCESGDPNNADFDCRFVNHFGTPGIGSAVTVPLCDHYKNGHTKCAYYRIENPPPHSKFLGPIDWYAAWNDDFYRTSVCPTIVNPTTYQCNNPQVADDPSAPHPDNDPNQFTTYITTYFNTNPNQVGIDPGIGGRTPDFNDIAVVFPQTGSNLTFTLMPPLRASGPNVFEEEDTIPVKFQLKNGSISMNNAATPPNVVGIAILDSNGVQQQIVQPGARPPQFRFVGNHYQLLLRFEDISLPPGNYTLIIHSNLFAEQTIPLTIIPD